MLKKLIRLLTWRKRLLKEINDSDLQWSPILESLQNSELKLTPKQLKKIGGILYEQILEKHLVDLHLSAEELNDLEKLSKFCHLEPSTVQNIKKKFAPKSIHALSISKLSDHLLTAEEKTEMYELADKLEVPRDIVDKVNSSNALSAYQTVLRTAIEDRRLNDAEELELKALATNLGLSDDIVKTELDKIDLTYFKLLNQVENGQLPQITASLPMQAKEICHFMIEANRLESKVVTIGYTGGSRGVSIRIAKGVSYRVGSFRSQPIKQEVTVKFPGTLIITSKRIIFTAVKKGFSIPLTKLTNIEPYADGIGLQKDAQYYLMQFEQRQTELIGLIITGAVNKL